MLPCWETSCRQKTMKIHVFGQILPNDGLINFQCQKKNYQKNYQTYSWDYYTVSIIVPAYRHYLFFYYYFFCLSFIFVTVFINNSFSYTSNVCNHKHNNNTLYNLNAVQKSETVLFWQQAIFTKGDNFGMLFTSRNGRVKS